MYWAMRALKPPGPRRDMSDESSGWPMTSATLPTVGSSVVTPTTMAVEAGAGLVGVGAGALSPWLPPPQDRTKAVMSMPMARAHRGGDIAKIAVQ